MWKHNDIISRILPFTITTRDKVFYRNSLIVLGIGLFMCAFYLNLDYLIATHNNSSIVNGRINSSEVIIENVSSTSRYGYKSNSQRANLLFSLKESNDFYLLRENIGQNYSSPKYNRIHRNLRRADNISILVRRSLFDSSKLIVFQIKADGITLLHFNEIKYKHSGIFIFLILMSVISISLGLFLKYPKKFKKLFLKSHNE